MLLPLLLLYAICTPLVWARTAVDYKLPETTVIFACLVTIDRSYTFNFHAEDNFWLPNCKYPPKVATFTACFNESVTDFNKSLLIYLGMCQTFGGLEVTQDELFAQHVNGTLYIHVPTDNIADLTAPVVPDARMVLKFNRLYHGFFLTINKGSDVGDLLNGYWLLLLGVLAFFNLLKSTRANKYLKGPFINNIRAHVTVPTLNKTHLQLAPFHICESLVPTRQEFYIISIYFALCLYGASSTYEVYAGNPLFGPPVQQWSRFIADRTGVILFTQLPLLFLFGGRNNLLIQVTGLSYSSFIMFHKWISRLMFSCGLVHGICYSFYMWYQHRLTEIFHHGYWNFGILAITTCFLIMVQAIYKFRKMMYEVFLVLHIVLLMVFLAACVAHCWSFGWLQWCYYSLMVWGLDRVLRIARMLNFGFPKLQILLLSRVDPTLKISVPKPANYHTYAGCFVFIHVLDWRFNFWESHPFTIYELNSTINIILKPKSGMTLKLYKHLVESGQDSIELRVAIEGPYGHHVPKRSYDKTLLLAGGNGIPGPFYHALEALPELKPHLEAATCRIKLVWVIRDTESLQWFYEELKMVVKSHIEIDIYVTRESLPLVSYGSIEASGDNSVKRLDLFHEFEEFQNVKFYCWRPNFAKLIRQTVLESGQLQSLDIISCGNATMCDLIRDETGRILNEFPQVRLDLYEELQVW